LIQKCTLSRETRVPWVSDLKENLLPEAFWQSRGAEDDDRQIVFPSSGPAEEPTIPERDQQAIQEKESRLLRHRWQSSEGPREENLQVDRNLHWIRQRSEEISKKIESWTKKRLNFEEILSRSKSLDSQRDYLVENFQKRSNRTTELEITKLQDPGETRLTRCDKRKS